MSAWRSRKSACSLPPGRSCMDHSSSRNRSRSAGCRCLMKSSVFADSSPVLSPSALSTIGLTFISSRRALHSHTAAPAPSIASERCCNSDGDEPNTVSSERKANWVTVKPMSSRIRTRPATSAETAMSPGNRPTSTSPAPNIHTQNSSHVGMSDSARSCPRSARNRVSARADAADEGERKPRKRRSQSRIDDRHGDERELRDHPGADQHAHEAVPQALSAGTRGGR